MDEDGTGARDDWLDEMRFAVVVTMGEDPPTAVSLLPLGGGEYDVTGDAGDERVVLGGTQGLRRFLWRYHRRHLSGPD